MKKIIIFLFIALLFTSSFLAQSGSSELVRVKDLIPNIILDIKYASTDNFFEQKLYTTNECYLLNDMVKQLILVQDSLNKVRELNGKNYPEGIGIKIWDGYRPRSVQYIMFEIFPDPTFVADPNTGSSHNRGGAVDITLVDLATGKELPMPTGFDDFSDAASHSFPSNLLPPEVSFNRGYLKNIMINVGELRPYNAEWWHYSVPNNNDYPLLDFQIK
jgi:D-alanyl-D-alanine dipeptidase